MRLSANSFWAADGGSGVSPGLWEGAPASDFSPAGVLSTFCASASDTRLVATPSRNRRTIMIETKRTFIFHSRTARFGEPNLLKCDCQRKCTGHTQRPLKLNSRFFE